MRRVVVAFAAALSLVPVAGRADQLYTGLAIINQVREGDASRDLEAPTILYGDLGARHHGVAVDSSFGLGHDFARNEGLFTDLYSASVRVPGAVKGVDFTLGRQFLAETPGGVFVADAGKVRFAFGPRESLSVFGGQPQYFEPTYSSETISQDETIWGATLRTSRVPHAIMSLSFLDQRREGHTLRRLVSGAGTWSRRAWPGMPNLFGSVSLDADNPNIDRANLGAQVMPLPPRLALHIDSTYYKPQDHGDFVDPELQRREDTIFELFSVSDLLQVRGGARFAFSPSLSSFANYSYQTYERTDGDHEQGHLGDVGLLWLPYGDGLEVVRLDYFIADSGGGWVNGGRAYYESSIYERLRFRASGNLAYYEKSANRSDIAVSTLLGLGYVVIPGLVCEVNVEANGNSRFDQEFRVGLWLTYNRTYRFGRDAGESAASGAPQS